jgi:hypothetical protein
MKIGSSEHSENSVHSVEKNLRKSGDCESTVDDLSDAARFLIEDGYRAVIGGLRIAV